MKKFKITIAVLSALFFVAANGRPASAAVCKVQSQIKALSNFKSNSQLEYADNIRNELKLRKDLLRAAIDCAASEASDTQNQLKSLKTEGDLKNSRDNLDGQLGEAINYLNVKKANINDYGIRGTQETARLLKEWRAGRFEPLYTETVNLKLWLRNQDLLKTSQKRLGQIEQTVKNLNLGDNEDIRNLLDESRVDLQKAQEDHNSAYDNLKKLENPEDTAYLIKSFLEHLSAAYDKFLDISAEVKKILTK